jgi:hypothetical protein
LRARIRLTGATLSNNHVVGVYRQVRRTGKDTTRATATGRVRQANLRAAAGAAGNDKVVNRKDFAVGDDEGA